jgi:16S rRNA A1518/A1519 N6-dimethyltransferase RsmA/KsgA/DIM1 with predicted DNA glycosylase/AP lyase activity
MIKSALKDIFKNTDELLNRANIDGNKRAENLSVAEFCKLANYVQ